jgi:phage baseplate assembly protein W
MATNTGKSQIQPRWPLAISPNHGPYQPVDDVRESVIQDFIFLLRTNPGEWPMNPDLGVGLERYLFEAYSSPELDQFRTRLEKQTRKYLPDIMINSAEFIADEENKDNNVVILSINFSIKFISRAISILLHADRLSRAINGFYTNPTPEIIKTIAANAGLLSSKSLQRISPIDF